ncbi:hypothetical protein ACUHMQ_03570 [Chitinimonas sp. PSY-7]|uniref:hypothetical protein n=1 Tax=Chitinimonas sp. PSY-7 TaxID=3459088 RepID=UPI00403FD5A6
MRKVELDFAQKPSGNPILGITIAVLGIVLLLVASWRQNTLDTRLARLDGQRWKQTSAQTSAERTDPQTITRARELAAQFGRPWEALFLQLEKTDVKGVQLSQVQPQAAESIEEGQRRVLLGGEADETASLYDYLRRLRDQSGLEQVHLLQQRWDDDANVIRFQIAAHWGSSKNASSGKTQ